MRIFEKKIQNNIQITKISLLIGVTSNIIMFYIKLAEENTHKYSKDSEHLTRKKYALKL